MKPFRWNKRRFAIAFYALSGWLPWGTDMERVGGRRDRARPEIHHFDGKWIVCCGHVMREPEIEVWKAHSLLIDGPLGRQGKPCLLAGPRLEWALANAWHEMTVRSWGSQL